MSIGRTYSGQNVNLMQQDPSTISILDIAHHLVYMLLIEPCCPGLFQFFRCNPRATPKGCLPIRQKQIILRCKCSAKLHAMRNAEMKNATMPSLRVNEQLRQDVMSVLAEGETLSTFMEESLILNLNRRKTQQEFIARGLSARDEARRTGEYVSEEDVMKSLHEILDAPRLRNDLPDALHQGSLQ